MATRTDLLRLPAGDRLATYRAARKRADARLRAIHREEYDAMVEAELANPEPFRRLSLRQWTSP